MAMIVAFDPGETTGYTKADVKLDDGNAAVYIRAVGHWSGMDELEVQLARIILGVQLVVIEDYIIYPGRAASHAGDRVYTAREIGRLEWIAFRAGVPSELQAASMAKQRWPDNRLYKHVPHARAHGPHVRDAIRHLLTYVEREMVEQGARIRVVWDTELGWEDV